MVESVSINQVTNDSAAAFLLLVILVVVIVAVVVEGIDAKVLLEAGDLVLDTLPLMDGSRTKEASWKASRWSSSPSPR